MAVRNGKVTLGQMETTFSYRNPLDPLSASWGPQKPSTVDLCVECTVEKGTQVDLEASEGLGGQKTASFLPGAGLGLAHSPLPGSPSCPVLVPSQGECVSTGGLLWRRALPRVLTCLPASHPPNRFLSDFAVRDAILFVFPSDTISQESFWSRE